MKKLLIGLSAFVVLLLNGCSPKPPSLHIGEGESLAQLKKACDRNDGKRCAVLGAMYMHWSVAQPDYKKIIKTDYQKAKKYSEKACKLNVAAGCYNLGLILMLEYDNTTPIKYYRIGQKYFDKGCTMGADGSCGKAWGHYNTRENRCKIAYPRDKFPNDVTKFKKACNLNDSAACVKVGLIYYRGIDLKQDYSESVKYFRKACDLNSGIGCNWLASAYISIGGWSSKIDWSEVKKSYKKACDLDIINTCKYYQIIHEKGRLF